MIDPTIGAADEFIEGKINELAVSLEDRLAADVLAFEGPLAWGVDDCIREAVETRKDTRHPKLAVIVQTTGGSVEVVERIHTVFRKHYGEVEFYVPNYAFSAGTVLVMSGDAIHMDYYSVLGPIDPQKIDNDRAIPASGYLVQYERLIDKSRKGELTTAELAFLLEKFDPAELYQFEQERNLSVTYLKDWLVRYKFKNWTVTESKKKPVTALMREERAKEVANILQDTDRWHTHGRGISMEVLRTVLNLQIEDFSEDRDTAKLLRSYYKLLDDFATKRGQRCIVHMRSWYWAT